MDSEALADTVGDDLCVLIREHAIPVASVARVSTLWSPSWNRVAFRLELADGSIRKGRRFESKEAADRAAYLGRYLPDGSFPRLVAQRGVAQLDEWVEGPVLSSCRILPDLLRRAGAVLGTIHAIDLLEPITEPAARPAVGRWRDVLEAKVGLLCRSGELAIPEATRIIDLANAHAPASVRLGLVHGDFSPENVVLDEDQDLRIIDNDSLAVRAREFDLARTWYRWPMTPDERRAFEEGYAPKDVLASYHAHFVHWAVVVLVGAAQFRCRHQLPDASVPITRLREMLACHGC